MICYGSLEVICGCMFSGKTEELIRRVRRALIGKKSIQVFKSHRDTRYSSTFAISHNGLEIPAVIIKKSSSEKLITQIEKTTDVIAIDEIQFFDIGIIDCIEDLVRNGKRVIVAGLDLDFRGEPFREKDGPMPSLLAISDKLTKLTAICWVCGGVATRTQRLTNGIPAKWNEPFFLKTGKDEFHAVCRIHHIIQKPPNNNLMEEYMIFEDE